MKLIYLRHLEKQWDNKYKGPYRHDPGLTLNDIQYFKKKLQEIKEHDVQSIFVSPYRRTRETCDIVLSEIKKPAFIDPNISEFLGHQRPIGSRPDVEPETEVFIQNFTLGTEKHTDLLERARMNIEYMKQQNFECALIITHGYFISCINNIIKGSDLSIDCGDYVIYNL